MFWLVVLLPSELGGGADSHLREGERAGTEKECSSSNGQCSPFVVNNNGQVRSQSLMFLRQQAFVPFTRPTDTSVRDARRRPLLDNKLVQMANSSKHTQLSVTNSLERLHLGSVHLPTRVQWRVGQGAEMNRRRQRLNNRDSV